ncbi:UNVERIFIED_CONTAM: hypothetical protein PYX00_005927 [Menopon gallinae]|uniref:Galectin n=1 Tax=Menopon gallinae TaxID=328185 RepID=A0AAW2HUF6_9NEOP
MNSIINPSVPFNIPIPGGVQPGKIIKLQGFTPYVSNRFAINLVCGPMGDVALHVCPKFDSKCVIRNTIQNMQMGYEERHGPMPIYPGQNFEVIILCDPQNFKIAFNGQHFTEFNHRLPYSAITNLSVDGQVVIHSVNYEILNANRDIGLVIPPSSNYGPPQGQPIPPYPSNAPGVPYPTNPPNYSGSPYPHNNPVYPPQTGYGNNNVPYPQNPAGYPVNGGYPHSPKSHGGYPHSPKSDSGFLNKAGMAVAGVLGGTALLGGKKAMKKQMKAHKKALKYGLPLAGAGIGAYALSKGFHGFRRSSSSSSSSSD